MLYRDRFKLLLTLVGFYFSACSVPEEYIDPTKFNNKLKANTIIKTYQDLVFAYDSTLFTAERKGDVNIAIANRSVKTVEITVTQHVWDDDEIAGEKTAFLVEHTDHWRVLNIRKSYLYRAGRP